MNINIIKTIKNNELITKENDADLNNNKKFENILSLFDN